MNEIRPTGATSGSQALGTTTAVAEKSGLHIVDAQKLIQRLSEKDGKFAPREVDQIEAIKKVLEGFAEHDRGKLILPCGTGKTLTSLWIKEQLFREKKKPTKTIVLLPSVALIKQTKDNWENQKRKDFDYLCVCSDKKVDAKDKPDEDSDDRIEIEALQAEGAKVTTDPDDIRKFLTSNKGNDQVIYSTYQSLPKITEALKDTDIKFDLAIGDEAHKTTGLEGALFTQMHDDANLPAEKRLYMTATPRVLGKQKSEDSSEIVGMDNEEIYGPEFHRMSFAEAIEAGILVDYKVVIAAIRPSQAKKYLNDMGGEDAKTIMSNIVLKQLMQDHKLKRALTFHSNKAKAHAFQKVRERLFGAEGLASYYIDGEMNVGTRDEIMEEFKAQANAATISNAKCLTEGVDVPAIDTVMFADPKESEVDIVQAVGRAIRQDPKNPNKEAGYVVIPVMLDSDTTELADAAPEFKTILNVINSLALYDERLESKIVRSDPFGESGGAPSIEIVELDDENIKSINADLGQEIISKVVSSSKDTLLGSEFKDFAEARERILGLCDTRPNNLEKFFSSAECPIGKYQLINLARKAGIKTSGLGFARIADEIWGDHLTELKTKIEDLKQRHPDKPKEIVELMELLNKELFLYERYKYQAAHRLVEEFNPTRFRGPESLARDLADYIWQPGVEDGAKFKELMQAHDRPANQKELEDLSWEVAHTSINTAYRLLRADEKIKFNSQAMMDAIWGPIPRLETYVNAIKEIQPCCPRDIDEFFTEANFAKLGLGSFEEFTRLTKASGAGKIQPPLSYVKQIWGINLFDLFLYAKSKDESAAKSLINGYCTNIYKTTGIEIRDSIYACLEIFPQELIDALQSLRETYPIRPKDVYKFYDEQVKGTDLETKLEAYDEDSKQLKIEERGKSAVPGTMMDITDRVGVDSEPRRTQAPNMPIFLTDFIWGSGKPPIAAIRARCQDLPMKESKLQEILIELGFNPRPILMMPDTKERFLDAVFDNPHRFTTLCDALVALRQRGLWPSIQQAVGVTKKNILDLIPRAFKSDLQPHQQWDFVKGLLKFPELFNQDTLLQSVRNELPVAPRYFLTAHSNSQIGKFTVRQIVLAAHELGIIEDASDASVAKLKDLIWATETAGSGDELDGASTAQNPKQQEYEELLAKLQKATKPSQPREIKQNLEAVGLTLARDWNQLMQLAEELGHYSPAPGKHVENANALIKLVWG